MSAQPTFYQLLGVDQNASPEALDEAFAQQRDRNHPDNGGNAAVWQLIEQAHSVLINPWAREQYNESLNRTPPHGNVIPRAAFSARNAEEAGAFHQDPPTAVQPAIDAYSDTEPDPWTTSTTANNGYGDDSSFIDLTEPDFTRNYDEPYVEDDIRVEPEPATASTGPRFIVSPAADARRPSWLPTSTTLKRVGLAVLGVWLLIGIFTPVQLMSGVSDGEAVLLVLWFLLAWVLLSFALRLSAVLLFVVAIGAALFNDANAAETTARLIGALGLWLVGHWIFTWRHEGRWKSTLAYAILGKLPNPLRPDRKYRNHLAPY